MTLKNILTLTIALIMSATTNRAWAEARLHTSMSSKSFYVGEEFTYEILVSGAKNVKAGEPDGSDDLRIQFVEKIALPQSDLTKLPDIALRYRMMPMTPGMVLLPMFSVDADGVDLVTGEEAFIDVNVPEGYPGLTLTRSIPTRDFYVGEPFRVDYVWKSPLPLSGYRAIQLYLPLFYEPQFKVRSLHHWIAGNDKAAIGLPVSNTRLIARYGHLEEAGTFFNKVSFSKILIPRKSGEMVMRKATLLASYIEPPQSQKRQRGWRTNYPSYFNNNFFEGIDREAFKKYYVASQQQTIRVLPLPDAGKPHDFAGQVGKRSVKVTASPKVVAAGDPITLTIEVNDCDFPEVLELPVLDKQVAFSRQFAIPAKQSRGRIEGEKKTYIITLRPRAQDVTAIPAVRLPYFDPLTKSYGVAESAPIPITVNAAETATAFDAEVSGVGPLRNLLQGNNEGIRANFITMTSSRAGGPTNLQWLLILLIFPPLAFFLFLRLTAHSRLMRRDPVLAKANRALPQFRKAIAQVEKMNVKSDPEQALTQLDEAVRSYFSDKFNLVRHAHTFEELESALSNRTDGVGDLDPIQQIYAACEQGNYRELSNPVDVSKLITLAKQSILTIDKKS